MYQVEVDDRGRVALPRRVVAGLEASSLQVESCSAGHVLLSVHGAQSPEIVITLKTVGIPDVLSFFNMFRKTGILHLDLADGMRRLFFKDGEIIFATSDRLEDDLGEVLCEMGKLERKELRGARAEISSDANLSQVLVKRQLVAARDLWLATRQQVESIVYGLFACDSGSCFFVPADPEQDNIVRLSMSTQNLIMEGLRRVDEKALYWRRLRGPEAMLGYSGKAPQELSSEEKNLMRQLYVSGQSVRKLLGTSEMSEYDTLRTLHQLVEKGMLEVTDREEHLQPLAPELETILAVFNEMLALLYVQVSPCNGDMLVEINRFIRELPHPHIYVFRGVQIHPDGTLDMRALAENLHGLELEEQKRLLVEALTEVVYQECSMARRDLGADAATEMVRRVQEFTMRARKLLE
ncbi:MAG: DUF4388 domain-containing protein [Desulfuromonadaceae bacterium]|nr:DUF4388 domain-containing protein [Desulfuromonadaceae bacterium]